MMMKKYFLLLCLICLSTCRAEAQKTGAQYSFGVPASTADGEPIGAIARGKTGAGSAFASWYKPAAYLNWAQSGVRIVCDGNSITRGVIGNPGGKSYTTLLSEILPYSGGNVTISNFGVDSQTTVDMSADAATQIDVLLSGAADVLVAWEGTNSLVQGVSYNDYTVDQAFDQIRTYCLARRAAGAERIVVVGTIPRDMSSAGGSQTAITEARLVAYNALLAQYWQAFADAYVDPRSIPELDAVADLADGTHPIEAGYSAFVNKLLVPALRKLRAP